MIAGARGVGPGLIESCGHVDPVEPSSELLNGSYTGRRGCLVTPIRPHGDNSPVVVIQPPQTGSSTRAHMPGGEHAEVR